MKYAVVDKREITEDMPKGKLMCIVEDKQIADLLLMMMDNHGEIIEIKE